MTRHPTQTVLIVLTALAAGAVGYGLRGGAVEPDAAWADGSAAVPLQPLAAYPIPTGPLDFCGEPVPLSDPDVRERFERDWLLTLNDGPTMALAIKRSARWFPYLEAQLKAAGVPDDFKYLVVAESGLRPDAVSSAGAAGMWQLIPAIARGAGLRVDTTIDERFDPERATPVALRYLLDGRQQVDSWTLTAAGFNRGRNGIRRDVESQSAGRAQSLGFYDLYTKPETSRYLFRIVAIKTILQSPERYGFGPLVGTGYTAPKTRNVSVTGPVTDLARWATDHGTTLLKLKTLNPALRGVTLPAGTVVLRLPE